MRSFLLLALSSLASKLLLELLPSLAALVRSLQLKMLTIRSNPKFNKDLSYLSNTFAPSSTDNAKRAIY